MGDEREYKPKQEDVRSYPVFPKGMRVRKVPRVHLYILTTSTRRSESPYAVLALVGSNAGRGKGGDDLQMGPFER